MGRVVTQLRESEPQLLALERLITKTMPRLVSSYGPGVDSRLRLLRVRLVRRVTAILRPIQRDARVATSEARALHLGACAAGINGG